MEVVLKKDLRPLGYKNDIVRVKPGYFRNYLSRTGIAVEANKHNKEIVELQKKKSVVRKEQVAVNAKAIAEKMKGSELKFKEKATVKGHLYGSIDERVIMDALKQQLQIEVDRSNVVMDEHIKEVGDHKITLKLNEEVEISVKVNVKAA